MKNNEKNTEFYKKYYNDSKGIQIFIFDIITVTAAVLLAYFQNKEMPFVLSCLKPIHCQRNNGAAQALEVLSSGMTCAMCRS